ncbi:MAG: hypothetical protein UY56_C0005G0072 [Parcubacteria group bacterium GW2011_GWA1_50_14]|nr:MAG: hypothetical protein UY56_C0005G0072 [Parcubacteria group bacterium GW2011_GWA1_50_14]
MKHDIYPILVAPLIDPIEPAGNLLYGKSMILGRFVLRNTEGEQSIHNRLGPIAKLQNRIPLFLEI